MHQRKKLTPDTVGTYTSILVRERNETPKVCSQEGPSYEPHVQRKCTDVGCLLRRQLRKDADLAWAMSRSKLSGRRVYVNAAAGEWPRNNG